MNFRKNIVTSTFIFLVVISVIIVILVRTLHHSSLNNDVCNYLPQIEKYKLCKIKFEKISPDPSYLVPYTIVMSFESNQESIIKDLGLELIENVDTSILKSKSWIEEYNLYFKMHSINGVRFPIIKKEIENIEWWKIQENEKVYAAPYMDDINKRNTVLFSKRNNGRIVCVRKKNIYFILIDCWG